METLSQSSGTFDDPFRGDDPDEEEVVNSDLPQLHRMWRNEKYSPEILPFNHHVVQNISEVVEFVAEGLDQERMSSDLDVHDPSYVLRCKELDRVRFVLRDYLRIRLWKLQQYPQYYLDPAHKRLLSPAELEFLTGFWANRRHFYHTRMLDRLPPAKQVLNDKMDLLDMVKAPNLDTFIYARIKEEVGELEVRAESLTQDASQNSRKDSFQKGKTYLLHYSIVRPFLIEPEHAGEDGDYPKVDLV
mmetsp:Transcript_20268/g.44256  ORF Transcript_20268/g.44256 Transcript_20268/m.44256 type:complete len:245 (+) Transcript_20268:175-909(+)